MKRKTPIRHKVNRHIREGRVVHAYLRGRGRNNAKMANPTMQKSKVKDDFEEYKVTFYYEGKRKETIDMAADNAYSALEEAFKLRKMQHLKPIRIDIRDGIGSFLGSIVGKVAGGVHSAINSFKESYAKGATERAESTAAMNESKASEKVFLEDKAKEMVGRARRGDRTAQIYCDDNHIAWELPIIT